MIVGIIFLPCKVLGAPITFQVTNYLELPGKNYLVFFSRVKYTSNKIRCVF